MIKLKNTEDRLKGHKITFYMLAVCVCLLVINIIALALLLSNRIEANYNTGIQAVNDIIEAPIESTDIKSTEGLDEISEDASTQTDSNIATASIEPEETDQAKQAEVEEIQQVDPYTILAQDIQNLKGGNKETIERYFGSSEVFSSETISDKLTATVVTFISSENINNTNGNETQLIVHICTLDYNKLKDESNNITNSDTTQLSDDDKVTLAKGVVQGLYDVHYNIPVKIINNQVVITEELKQAITGNWYQGIGVSLTPIECPLTK